MGPERRRQKLAQRSESLAAAVQGLRSGRFAAGCCQSLARAGLDPALASRSRQRGQHSGWHLQSASSERSGPAEAVAAAGVDVAGRIWAAVVAAAHGDAAGAADIAAVAEAAAVLPHSHSTEVAAGAEDVADELPGGVASMAEVSVKESTLLAQPMNNNYNN